MNFTEAEAKKYLDHVRAGVDEINPKSTTVAVAPPFTSLSIAKKTLKGSKIKLGAQNMYYEEKGAFTGEISPIMVAEFAEYVILGHSERRHILGERDVDIKKKVSKALGMHLVPILAVGETHLERQEGAAKTVVGSQLSAGLSDLTAHEVPSVVIAYEPIWAIGTGVACSPDEAARMIAYIRKEVSEIYGAKAGRDIYVLYGGSVDSKNIKGFIAKGGIDGALVGGASLKLAEFLGIIKAAEGTAR